MSKTEQSSGFLSEVRRTVWPIEPHELKKFLPMAGMMFFILFNYSMLRSIKDGFVLDDIGPEAISFLKTYVVLPSAVIAMIAYAKLCNALSPQKVFYTVTGFFITYLAFFAFVLNLHPDFGHPTKETIEHLCSVYPNFKWFIRIVGNWGVASFYAMAELWGSMMLSLLFWQFANQITKTSEAKRFYSMFGLLGNFSLPIVGMILGGFLGDNAPEYFKTHLTPFTPVLSICIINGLIVMVLYSWTNNNVLSDLALYDPSAKAAKKSKAKLSLVESFKLIFSSKYLGLIATLILAYGVSINLVEGVWKSKLKEMYHTKEAITAYMGQFQIYTGIGAIAFMIIGSNILRRVSWMSAAMITPAMILVTGGIFFAFIFFDKELAVYLIGISPLAAAVTMGMLQNVLSKATKYSLFDSTKEMTYIPLDDELKSKGKAAVDVVGGRLGKSGGGIIQSTFFMLIPTFTFVEATPYFAGIFFVVVIVWLYAVKTLSHEYQNQIKDHSY